MKLRNNHPVKLIFIIMLVLTIFSATAIEYDVIVNENDGKVDYVDLINSSANLTDLENAVTINNAYISVDTGTYPELDTLATLTFYNITLDNPIFTKNGWWMDNEYTVIEGEEEYADNYEVDVEGFSIWEMIESNFSLGTHNQTSIFNGQLSLSPDSLFILDFDDNESMVYDNSAMSFMGDTDIDTSAPSYDTTDCKYGSGCLFFGTNESGDTVVDTDYVKLDNDNSNPSANFTWCAWYKPTTSSGNNRIISAFGGGGGFQLFHVSDNNRAYVYNESGDSHVLQHISSSENVWNHMCFVLLDDNNASLFYNGNPEDNTDIGTYAPSGYDYLTLGSTNELHRYDGNVQCVQMWDTPLNPSQIADVNSSATCDDTLHSPSHTWKLNEYTKTQEDSVGDDDGDMGAFYTNESQFGTGAFEFDGVDDYINAGDISEFDSINDTFTMSLWVKMNDISSEQVFIDRFAGGGYSFRLHQVAGHLRLRVSPNGAYVPDYVQEVNVLNNGELAHIVVTFDKGNVTFYKNGTELNTHDIGYTHIYNSDLDVIIGGSSTSSRYFNGIMDEVQIFDRVLSESEIGLLYNSPEQFIFRNAGDYTTITHDAEDYDPEIEEQIWENLTLNYFYDVGMCGGYCNPVEVEQYIYAQSSEDNITWTGWVLGTLDFSNTSTSIYTFPDGSLQGRYIKGFIGWESNNSEEDDLIESYSFTGFKALKPSASDLNIYPDNATTMDNIYGNATFNLNDTDTGLSMDFVWYADDVQIYTETINGLQNGSVAVSTLPPLLADKDEDVYFTVTPIGSLDVEGDSVQSDNVTVQNANFSIDDYNPSSQNITLTIPNAYTFNLDITDPDNDVVCNWTLNGEVIFTGNPFVFSSGSYYSGINELEVECTDGEFTDTVTWNLTLEETDLTLPMIIGLAFVTFILLFFAFNLDKEHFIFKMLLIFLSLITLILIPTTLISGVNSVKDNFLKIGLWLFRLFVVYFSIYLFYHWTKKTEVLKKWFK